MTLAVLIAVLDVGGLLLAPSEVAAVRERLRTDPASKAAWETVRRSAESKFGESTEVPDRGGQWWHHYYCKVCSKELRTEAGDRHVCPKCGKVYSGWPYDDVPIMVRHLNLAGRVREAGLAYVLSGDRRFADSVEPILTGYAEKYAKYELHDKWARPTGGGRVTSQALDDAGWLQDLVIGYAAVAPAFTPEVRAKIEAGVLKPAAEFLLSVDRNSNRVGNHECWHAAAAALVGLATGDAALVDEAVKCIGRQLERGVLEDGCWFEGAWGYHFYTMESLAAYFLACRKARLPAYDSQLSRYHALFRAPFAQLMTGWRLPSNGDTGAREMKPGSAGDLYRVAAILWPDDDMIGWWASQAPETGEQFLLGVGVRCRCTKDGENSAVGLHLRPTPSSQTSCVCRASGLAVLRSPSVKNEPPRTTLAFDFGPHGGWHGHFDKLSYELWQDGQAASDDPGCAAYSTPLHFAYFRQTLAHNTVGVDGRGQKPVEGRLVRFDATPGRAMAVATAEIADGVVATRALSLDEGVVLDLLSVESADEHVYDWFYHAPGELKTSVESVPHSFGARVVHNPEKLQIGDWDGSEAYTWLENTRRGAHDGEWSAEWTDGQRRLSLKQVSASGELFSGLGWGMMARFRQSVVFNRVKGRRAVFGTAIGLNGLRPADVSLRQTATGDWELSATVGGRMRTLVLNSQPTTTNPQHNTENE